MKVSKLNPNAASFVPRESINTNPSPPPSDHDHHRRRSRPRPRPRNNNDDAVVVAVGPRKNSGKVWRPKTMLHNNNNNIIGSTSTQPASSSSFTTLMIKNVPSRYTREMLIEFVDNFCKLENDHDEDDHIYSAYDFLYLPMDFRRKLNKGYAFVNFTDARAALKFWEAMDHKKWDYFKSPKIRQIVHATIQGREALVRRFRKSEFGCEFEEYLPISFCPARDGSNGFQSRGTNIGRVMIGSTNNY